MVGSEGNSASHFGMLRRALLILGCLLFLSSMILPFLNENRPHLWLMDWGRTSYWSFKSSTTEHTRSLFIYNTVEYWFYDYWVTESAFRSDLLLVFFLMFVVQILTLLAGTASILINRRVLALAPAILCPMVTALMVYVAASLEHMHSYQQGYWLTYPSMLLFIIAFILTLVTNKKQATS